jgi:6-phosphofructokinase 1
MAMSCNINTYFSNSNSTLPFENMKEVGSVFEKFHIDGLLIIGDRVAYTALQQLRCARDTFESLRIPMVLLPATASNNMPGTDYSLGTDTCLNALVQYCGICRLSASSSRRRVFVVETQADGTGYVTLTAAIAIGALATHTPQEKFDTEVLLQDIDYLRETFSKDCGQNDAGKSTHHFSLTCSLILLGKIILHNASVSQTYSASLVTSIIREEANGRFSANIGIPGYFQQGKEPSPIDRVRALLFSIQSLKHLETFATMSKDQIQSESLSTAIVGLHEARIAMSALSDVEQQEIHDDSSCDQKYWRDLKALGEVLEGRQYKLSFQEITEMPV